MKRATAALAMMLALGACGGTQRANGVTDRDAIFAIHTNLRDAALWVDGKFVATVDALRGGFAVAPGHHRIELRHDDYFSNYLELDATRAQRSTLELPLSPILP